MQKFLFLLLGLVLLSPLGIDLYLPTIPAIARGLNSSEYLIQSTIALFIFVLGLGQLVAGPLVDKYGRKPIAIIGIILYMFGSGIAALATNPTIFVIARLLQAVATCGTAVVAFSGVRDRLNGNDAARAFGFLNGTLNIVPALAPLLGGLLAEAFGWRASFWFLVLYSLCLLIVIVLFLPETRPATTHPVKGLPLKNYLRILRHDRFLVFALVNAGVMGMAVTYVTLAPNVLMMGAGLTPLQFSLVFGLNGFWVMLVSFFANRVIQKVGRPFCLLMGSLLMAVGCIILLLGFSQLSPLLQNHWLAYMLPVASACAGLAFMLGPATSYALESYANEAGVASALVGFIQMAGGSTLGLLAMSLPVPPKFSLALVMLIGCVLAWIAHRASKKTRGQLQKII